jgi:hypothetical protein
MKEKVLKYSINGKRKLTKFQCENLLLDFINSNLDIARQKALESELSQNKELLDLLKSTKEAVRYLDSLSKIQPNPSDLDQLKQPTSYLNVLLAKINFADWSEGFKTGFELLVLSIGVISVSIVIPWHRVLELRWLPAKPYILAVVEKNKTSSLESDGTGEKSQNYLVVDKEEVKEEKEFIDLGIPQLLGASTTTTAAASTDELKKKAATANAEVDENDLESNEEIAGGVQSPADKIALKPSNSIKPDSTKGNASPVATTTGAAVAGVAQTGTASASEPSAAEKKQGFLYRGSISVTDVGVATQKFIEKINELGGKKAGSVELGWRKGNSAYFHLTMPEAQYQNLVDFAVEYGSLNLQKEKHERVMRDGIIRIIFTINEKK